MCDNAHMALELKRIQGTDLSRLIKGEYKTYEKEGCICMCP